MSAHARPIPGQLPGGSGRPLRADSVAQQQWASCWRRQLRLKGYVKRLGGAARKSKAAGLHLDCVVHASLHPRRCGSVPGSALTFCLAIVAPS
jgi:hypothetical protein